MFEQELAPLPGIFTRFVRLSHKRQTLQRELRSIGKADTPTAYPPPMRQLRSVEVANRFLDTVPRGGVRRSGGTGAGGGLTRCQQLGTWGGVSGRLQAL